MEATPLPDDVAYVPSVPELEALPVFEELQNKIYGELPIQVGYCNGHNKKLNALSITAAPRSTWRPWTRF